MFLSRDTLSILLCLMYAEITLAVSKDRFPMEETRDNGFSGEAIVIVEMRVNKELN